MAVRNVTGPPPYGGSHRRCSRDREAVGGSHLPRLQREWYRGRAAIHWIMAVDGRKRGWLDPVFHFQFREALLHGLSRYLLVCPAYCLMPDHMHMLLVGCSADSDQRIALPFLRRRVNHLLAPHRLQKQCYDHVLRVHERERPAMRSIAYYIAENPVRKGLVKKASLHSFSGCMVPGYPELSIHEDDHWDKFWRIWNQLVAAET